MIESMRTIGMMIGIGGLGAAVLGQPSPNGGSSSTNHHEDTASVDSEESGHVSALARRVERIPNTTVEIEFVRVPAGTRTAPNPENLYETIEVPVDPFWISTTEITWDAFDIFVYALDEPEEPDENDAVARPSKPYLPPDRGFGHEGYAAISMTYRSADAFCDWLSEKTGRTYRLPTVAEWEYAIAAGSEGRYSFGDALSLLEDHAWYTENSDWQAQPVAQKKPNAWGIYDGHGNVAEWCTRADGQPVACGGSFLDDADKLTLNSRVQQDPSWNMSDPQIPKSEWWLADATFVGFRIVCVPDEQDDKEN